MDLNKFLAVYNIECHCAAVPGSEYNYLNQANRGVEEKIDAAFLMADFNYDLFSIPLRGNVGVRHARTDMNSFALVNANGTLEPVRARNRYNDYLPALNVSATVAQDVMLRFSAGKTRSQEAQLQGRRVRQGRRFCRRFGAVVGGASCRKSAKSVCCFND